MGVYTGIQPLVTYNQATDPLKVAALLALIPDPDNPGTSGTVAGGGFLDEMSPSAIVQLRVELTALMAAVT